MVSLKSEKTLKVLSIIIFIIYIILLLWVVVFKCNLLNSIKMTYEYLSSKTLKERFNCFIVPFNDYFMEPFNKQRLNTFKDDMLNIIIFMPLGLYLSYFIKSKKFLNILICSISLSILFEVFQLFSLIGSFATKDFITNCLGGIFGYLIYKLVYKENKNNRLILNICSLLVILIFLPIACYAVVNTIKNLNFYVSLFN